MSAPLVRIAVCSIALGVLVMIMSVSILRGFQKEITRKVVGFGSHIVVQGFNGGNQFETLPISCQRDDSQRLRNTEGVKHFQCYATKGGMIKTDNQIHGILLKGISCDYDTSFFHRCLCNGRMIALTNDSRSPAANEVIISQTVANKLQLGVGDKLRSYFLQDNGCRARAFRIVGIYNTDLTDFDNHYVIGNLVQVQRLNGWDEDEVEGYELLVSSFDQLPAIADRVRYGLGYDLTIRTVIENNPALFAWLDLLNSNIVLILFLMALVCVVAVVSALLIMIFEKASTIGLLKAIGASNASIRRIFLIRSVKIIGMGIVIGDALALLIGWLQWQFQVVKLDSEAYSMSAVPIDLNPWIFGIVSVCTLVVCVAVLIIPSAHITHITPAKSMKFE